MRPYLVQQLLETSAARHPQKIALVDRTRTITYGELDCRANHLAHLLLDHGMTPGDRVGVYLEKSIEAVVSVYAAMKAGGAYVPIDPLAPPARVGYIAADCTIRFLLTSSEKTGALPAIAEADTSLDAAVTLDAADSDVIHGVQVLGSAAHSGYPDEAPPPRVVNLDLAYILYTSGSTGRPKGVMLSHLNALTFIEWAADTFGVRSDDRVSSHAPLHFDLSVFDLFAAARGGASVVLVPRAALLPRDLATFIEDKEISIWYSVPSALIALVRHGGLTPKSLPHLRTVLFAGEVFPTKHLRRLMAYLPRARFYNLYGPTETNVCTYHEVKDLPPDDVDIPIGRAIPGVQVFAVGGDGQTTAPHEAGELCVRGPGVMEGYWGDPQRTSNALSGPLPAAGLRTPSYRTGDLVRKDEGGNYLFLGRKDAQVKSRGFRIELGEIEAVLRTHPAVTECAALAVPDENVSNRIAAFVTAVDLVGESEILRYCGTQLPRYMVPEVLKVVAQLPRTSTAKIDRQSLGADAVPFFLEP
jgi:amino acid adenylation domain-containing protein